MLVFNLFSKLEGIHFAKMGVISSNSDMPGLTDPRDLPPFGKQDLLRASLKFIKNIKPQ